MIRRLSTQDCTRLAMGVETAVVLEDELHALEVAMISARELLVRLATMGGATATRAPQAEALRQDARAFLHLTREPVET